MTLDTRRHDSLFDNTTFNTPVTIIGAGATGSWLALFLAKLGITDITVWDDDVVEEHNIPNQAYGLDNVGDLKVDALGKNIYEQTKINVKCNAHKFKNQRLNGIVFLMVDTMSGRKEIWENSIKMQTQVKLLIEPRMGLNEGRIYCVDPCNLGQARVYESAWYPDDEAEVSACGSSESVITSAVATASWCCRQLINYHAGVELDNEILIDYMYNNIYPTKW